MDMCNVIKNYNFKNIYKFSNLLEKLDLQFTGILFVYEQAIFGLRGPFY